MDVRIATLNIFGYPASFLGNTRDAGDRAKVGELIKRLDSDIIVFQEIVDLDDLERLLSGLVHAREYRLKDAAGRWIASGGGGTGMKVVLAFDRKRLELLEAGKAMKAGQPTATGGMRDPVAARLRPVGGVESLTVVGVHLKSGYLNVGPAQDPDDDVRVQEVNNLIDWIESLWPILPDGQPRPDFNAVRGNISVAPILSGAKLVSWSWPEPHFASTMSPSPVPLNLPESERWTTHLDKKIIDHVLLSPEVKLVEGPWVYVFDGDASWLAAAGVSEAWLEKKDYIMTPGNPPTPVKKENLHRITDHRPVRLTVALT
jgi:hypothetical protein